MFFNLETISFLLPVRRKQAPMKTVKQGKIQYMQPSWVATGSLVAGFTTRNGGSSRSPYNSLNLGFSSGDQSTHVEANRAMFARAFQVEPHLLLTVKQVHGSEIVAIDQPNPEVSHFQRVECDAIITNQGRILIGILVADCYPVILYDHVRRVSAVIHLGWRGTATGLLGLTIKAMQNVFGSQAGDIMAAVGPGIAAHSYEVDRPVRDAFRAGVGQWDQVAREVRLGHWQLDLKASILLQLASSGIDPSAIDVVNECTCCHKETFYSYRRDQGRTGRQMGFVLLK
jgi:YfiH family protein